MCGADDAHCCYLTCAAACRLRVLSFFRSLVRSFVRSSIRPSVRPFVCCPPIGATDLVHTTNQWHMHVPTSTYLCLRVQVGGSAWLGTLYVKLSLRGKVCGTRACGGGGV